MDISAFKRDASAIEAGRWVGDLPNAGDVRLRVRGLLSRAYEHALAERIRDLPRSMLDRYGRPTMDAFEKTQNDALADAVLFEWENLTVEGKPVPYDPELARRWITDRDFVLFRNLIRDAANVVDNEAAAIDGIIEKN
jgi:hypothetical protein